MPKIEFHQTNYIGKVDGKNEIKICPVCNIKFSVDSDDCPNCGLYLPSFPTSWARSATNIFLLRKVLEYIYLELKGECNIESLSKILTKNYIISFDTSRVDDEKYWKGGPMRRASEYLSNLQYLGFLLKENQTYKLTQKGNSLVLAKDYSEYITSFSEAFMHLKIGNEYDINGFYSPYNNHILFQCLRIINDLKNNLKPATIENLALAIMSKDESTEYEKALKVSIEYGHKKIREIWFSKGKEFDRVVRGVFVRWLNQTKMIDIENKEGTTFVSLTNFGKNLFEKYKEKYLSVPSLPAIEDKDIKSIIEGNLDKQYLRLSISSESTNRTGAVWETVVKENLNKLNLDVKWYKESKDFVSITLPDEVLMSLTGGTRHNPDLILKDPLWLIDPKKDVNAEMHKVCAYDKYGKIVNGLSVIVTQKIMRSEKVSMMRTLNLKNVLVLDGYALQVLSDNNTFFTKEKVVSIIKESHTSKIFYLNEEIIFDNYIDKKIEKYTTEETPISIQKEIAPKIVKSPYVGEMVGVPLVGSAPCGLPIMHEDNTEEIIMVEKDKLRSGVKYFILRASGDSMDKAGIEDGDLVLCRYAEKGETGDRVVALLGGENVTIKYYDKKDGRRILLPKSSNPKHKPIIPEEGDEVQGIVQEVIKINDTI